jgi:hypothetical protein
MTTLFTAVGALELAVIIIAVIDRSRHLRPTRPPFV